MLLLVSLFGVLIVRILALDVGDKRIGIAVSDSTCTIAIGLTTIERKSENFLEKLKALMQEYNVGEIIVGIPLKINGTEGAQAKNVREFEKQIKKQLGIPIKEWDERLTSLQAEKTLISGDVRRVKRKSIVDQVAAVLILQSYLDNLNRKM
jgi:putative Holliday junction resolvase